MRFYVTIERLSDNRRFMRVIIAGSADQAMRQAYQMLQGEPDDYCVLSAVSA